MIRTIPLLLVSVAALALASCNNEQQVKTVSTPCQCALPPQSAAQVATATPASQMSETDGRTSVRPWQSSHRAWHTHNWRRDGAYESGSGGHRYGPEDEVPDNDIGERSGQVEESAHAVWTDGYGHRHYDSEYALYDRHDRKDVDDHTRLAPWHSYDGHDGLENGY